MSLADQIAAAKAAANTAVQPAGAAIVQPAAAVVQPGTSNLAQVVSQVSNLGGGSRLANTVMDALRTATTGTRRNDAPLGTGIYLLKSGKFEVKGEGKYKISSFSMLCLQGNVDGSGIAYGSQGYSGPVPTETYEISVFQDMSAKYQKGTVSKNLSILQACMNWTFEQVKTFQSTDKGLTTLVELLKGLLCVDIMNGMIPTGVDCIFSNQVVVQISTKTSVAEQKDPAGNKLFDAAGNVATKSYVNNYWDKKIPVADIPAMIGDEATLKAFGSQEAFMAAHTNEQGLASL